MKTYREDLKDAVLAVFYRAHDQYDPRLTEEMDSVIDALNEALDHAPLLSVYMDRNVMEAA